MHRGIFRPHSKMARPLTGLGELAWRNTNYDAETAALQQALNAQLGRLGYNPIGVDGELGAKTCGAYGTLSVSDSCLKDATCAALVQKYYGALLGGGTTSGGLCQSFTYPSKVGSTAPSPPPALKVVASSVDPSTQPAWNAVAPSVKDLQARMNPQLVDLGYQPVPIDGTLNAVTCGAMRVIDQRTGQQLVTLSGQNCQAFTDPTPAATAQLPSSAAFPPAPGPTYDAAAATKPKMSAATMLAGVGIAGAIAAVWYVYSQHQAAG